MFNYFKKRYEEKIAEINKEIEERVVRLKEHVLLEKKEMLSKPCPINNMNSCVETCVHFRKGYVYSPDPFNGIWPYKRSPKCKLWK